MWPEDIVSVLYKLIRDNWNPVNTNSITPLFGTGYLNAQDPNPHQVHVENVPADNATGTSGIHGINPGGGNNQLFRGLAFVDCIAEEGDNVADPDYMSNLFSMEVARIVRANTLSIVGYDYISFLGYNRIPPRQGDHPFKITRSCRIGFQWRIEV